VALMVMVAAEFPTVIVKCVV